MSDDLRTRAREAAEEAYRKPRWHVGTVTDRLIEAFCEGFLAHAAQQPSREQIAEVLWNRANRWEPGMLPFNDICSVEREYWMKDADAVLALFDGAGS